MSKILIQTYYDLDLYAKVNVTAAIWSSKNPIAVTISNIASIIILALCVIFPLLIICFHLKEGSGKWGDPDFKKKHGTLLEKMQVFKFVPLGAD